VDSTSIFYRVIGKLDKKAQELYDEDVGEGEWDCHQTEAQYFALRAVIAAMEEALVE
jgi:hypothetical protein